MIPVFHIPKIKRNIENNLVQLRSTARAVQTNRLRVARTEGTVLQQSEDFDKNVVYFNVETYVYPEEWQTIESILDKGNFDQLSKPEKKLGVRLYPDFLAYIVDLEEVDHPLGNDMGNNTVKITHFGKEINTALDLYNIVEDEERFGAYDYIEYDDVRNEITMGSVMGIDSDSKLVEHIYRLSSRSS